MDYLIFINDGREFDTNGEGKMGTLDDHLKNLRTWDGSPDHWSGADDLLEALQIAKEASADFRSEVVVTDEYYDVIERYDYEPKMVEFKVDVAFSERLEFPEDSVKDLTEKEKIVFILSHFSELLTTGQLRPVGDALYDISEEG